MHFSLTLSPSDIKKTKIIKMRLQTYKEVEQLTDNEKMKDQL